MSDSVNELLSDLLESLAPGRPYSNRGSRGGRGGGRGSGRGGRGRGPLSFKTICTFYGTDSARLAPYSGHVDDSRLAAKTLYHVLPGPPIPSNRGRDTSSLSSMWEALCHTEAVRDQVLVEGRAWKVQFGSQVVYFEGGAGLEPALESQYAHQPLSQALLQKVVDGPRRSTFAAKQLQDADAICRLLQQEFPVRSPRVEFLLRISSCLPNGQKKDLTLREPTKDLLLQGRELVLSTDTEYVRLMNIVVAPCSGRSSFSDGENVASQRDMRGEVSDLLFRVWCTARGDPSSTEQRTFRITKTNTGGVDVVCREDGRAPQYLRLQELRVFPIRNTPFEIHVTVNEEWGDRVGRNEVNVRVEMHTTCSPGNSSCADLFHAFLARADQLHRLLTTTHSAKAELPVTEHSVGWRCRAEIHGAPCTSPKCTNNHYYTACHRNACGLDCGNEHGACQYWHAVQDVQAVLDLCLAEVSPDSLAGQPKRALCLDKPKTDLSGIDAGQAVALRVALSLQLKRILAVCGVTHELSGDSTFAWGLRGNFRAPETTELEDRAASGHSELAVLVKQYNAFILSIASAYAMADKSFFQRACTRMRQPLPVLAERDAVVSFCRPHHVINKEIHPLSPFLLLSATTGSGKSTQVPQYMAECAALDVEASTTERTVTRRLQPKLVVCVQPRSLAAASLAERVATEYDGPLGKTGNRVCFMTSSKARYKRESCRILYTTNHAFLSMLEKHTLDLERDVYAVILDEAHERSIVGDMLLGILKERVVRWSTSDNGKSTPVCPPPFRVVVCSATLQQSLYQDYLNNPCTLNVPGRVHPIAISYSRTGPSARLLSETEYIDDSVKAVCQLLQFPEQYFPSQPPFRQTSKYSDRRAHPHILVFLPTAADAEEACERFTEVVEANVKVEARSNAAALADDTKRDAENEEADGDMALDWSKVHPFTLSGRQDVGEQRKAFEKLEKGVVKVIFATAVAETSVTIDGVGCVVDTGLTRHNVYDPARGLSELSITPVSQSTAQQRAGRAGRTGPGVCLRLYSRSDLCGFAADNPAALHTSPLHAATLHLALLNRNIRTFDWVEKPSTEALHATLQELVLHQAVKMPGSVGTENAGLDVETVSAATILPFGRFLMGIDEVSVPIASLLYRAASKKSDRYLAVAALVAAVVQNAPRLFCSPKAKRRELEKVIRSFAHEHQARTKGDIICAAELVASPLMDLFGKHKMPNASVSETATAEGDEHSFDDESETTVAASTPGPASAKEAAAKARAFASAHFLRFSALGDLRKAQCKFFRSAQRLAHPISYQSFRSVPVPVLSPADVHADAGELIKEIAQAFCHNIAVRRGEEKVLYRTLGKGATECVLVNRSFVKQCSALPSQCGGPRRGTDFFARELPELCVFPSLLSFSSNDPAFITLCSPVRYDWLPEEVRQAVQAELNRQEIVRVLPVPTSLVHLWNLEKLAAWLTEKVKEAGTPGTSHEREDAHAPCRVTAVREVSQLSVTCERQDEALVMKSLREVIEGAVAGAQGACVEVALAGACRVACGQGGEGKEILRDSKAYVTVEATRLLGQPRRVWPWFYVHTLVRSWWERRRQPDGAALPPVLLREPYSQRGGPGPDGGPLWKVFATFASAADASDFTAAMNQRQGLACSFTPFYEMAPLAPPFPVLTQNVNVSVHVHWRDADPERNYQEEVPLETVKALLQSLRDAIPEGIEVLSTTVDVVRGVATVVLRAPSQAQAVKLTQTLRNSFPRSQAPQPQRLFTHAVHQVEFPLPALANNRLVQYIKKCIREHVKAHAGGRRCDGRTFTCSSRAFMGGRHLCMESEDPRDLVVARRHAETLTSVGPLLRQDTPGQSTAIENESWALSRDVRRLLAAFDTQQRKSGLTAKIQECQIQMDVASKCLCFIGEENTRRELTEFIADKTHTITDLACVQYTVASGRVPFLRSRDFLNVFSDRGRRPFVYVQRHLNTTYVISEKRVVQYITEKMRQMGFCSSINGELVENSAEMDKGRYTRVTEKPVLEAETTGSTGSVDTPPTRADCFVCFMPLHPDSVRLVCGHEACRECLEGQFVTEGGACPELPLRCWAPGCGSTYAAVDVQEVAPPRGTQGLGTYARTELIKEAADAGLEAKECPNKMCLGVPVVVSFDKRACAGCNLLYCEVCTQPGEPVSWHDGAPHRGAFKTLEEDVLEGLPFLPKCPKCGEPFYDFTGCFAVSCSDGHGFCGFCMTSCRDSSDTHDHVRRCPRNPGSSYFASLSVFYQCRADDFATALEKRLTETKIHLTAERIEHLFQKIFERLADEWPKDPIEKVKATALHRLQDVKTPTSTSRQDDAPSLDLLPVPETIVAAIPTTRLEKVKEAARQLCEAIPTPYTVYATSAEEGTSPSLPLDVAFDCAFGVLESEVPEGLLDAPSEESRILRAVATLAKPLQAALPLSGHQRDLIAPFLQYASRVMSLHRRRTRIWASRRLEVTPALTRLLRSGGSLVWAVPTVCEAVVADNWRSAAIPPPQAGTVLLLIECHNYVPLPADVCGGGVASILLPAGCRLVVDDIEDDDEPRGMRTMRQERDRLL